MAGWVVVTVVVTIAVMVVVVEGTGDAWNWEERRSIVKV